MSGGEIVAIAKFAGSFLAAKTAIEGLEEGNIGQAILGGIGAYYGFTNLGAATTTQTGVSQGASGVADKATAVTGGEAMAGATGNAVGQEGMTNAMRAMEGTGAGEGIFADLGNAVTDGASAVTSDMSGILGEMPAEPAYAGFDPASGGFVGDGYAAGLGDYSGLGGGLLEDAGMTSVQKASEPGFIDNAMRWAEDNPELAQGILNTGGNMLSGYAQGKAREEMLDRKLRELENRRRRRGAVPSLDTYRFGRMM